MRSVQSHRGTRSAGTNELHITNEYFVPVFRNRDYRTYALHWNTLYGIGYAGVGNVGYSYSAPVKFRDYAVDAGLGTEASVTIRDFDVFLSVLFAHTFKADAGQSRGSKVPLLNPNDLINRSQIGPDFADAVDLANHLDRNVLLQLLIHLSGDRKDTGVRIDVEPAAVERAMCRELPFGNALDGLIVRRLNHLDQIRDARVAEVLNENTGTLGKRSVARPSTKHDDASDLDRRQSIDLDVVLKLRSEIDDGVRVGIHRDRESQQSVARVAAPR